MVKIKKIFPLRIMKSNPLSILAGILILLFVFRLWQTTGCKNFKNLTFNPLSVKISVETDINTDKDGQIITPRIFHNKLTVAPQEISKSYAKIFEPSFLLDILGPLGLILIILSVKNVLFTKTNKTKLSHFSVLAVGLFSPLLLQNTKIGFLTVSLLLYTFTIWSLTSLNSKKGFLIFALLAVFNLWFFLINWEMKNVCNEIFFN